MCVCFCAAPELQKCEASIYARVRVGAPQRYRRVDLIDLLDGKRPAGKMEMSVAEDVLRRSGFERRTLVRKLNVLTAEYVYVYPVAHAHVLVDKFQKSPVLRAPKRGWMQRYKSVGIQTAGQITA